MSDFHLKADIPPDATPQETTDIRAAAFKTALMHAATDDAMRAKMILGEAFGRYVELIAWLERELARESDATRQRVAGFADGLPIPGQSSKAAVVAIQQRLASDWHDAQQVETWPVG